uniref:Uncharacterized protein n=1 Tax=Tanacetum cinerariifolium TaxID=118510 RepID=A0A699GQE2_TANCI|nr:hypothetical protein [Tanacetum cinerariifolium]
MYVRLKRTVRPNSGRATPRLREPSGDSKSLNRGSPSRHVAVGRFRKAVAVILVLAVDAQRHVGQRLEVERRHQVDHHLGQAARTAAVFAHLHVVVAGDNAQRVLVFLGNGVVGAIDFRILHDDVALQLQARHGGRTPAQFHLGADVLHAALVQLRHLGARVDLRNAALRAARGRIDVTVDVDRAARREVVVERRHRRAEATRQVAQADLVLADMLDRADFHGLAVDDRQVGGTEVVQVLQAGQAERVRRQAIHRQRLAEAVVAADRPAEAVVGDDVAVAPGHVGLQVLPAYADVHLEFAAHGFPVVEQVGGVAVATDLADKPAPAGQNGATLGQARPHLVALRIDRDQVDQARLVGYVADHQRLLEVGRVIVAAFIDAEGQVVGALEIERLLGLQVQRRAARLGIGNERDHEVQVGRGRHRRTVVQVAARHAACLGVALDEVFAADVGKRCARVAGRDIEEAHQLGIDEVAAERGAVRGRDHIVLVAGVEEVGRRGRVVTGKHGIKAVAAGGVAQPARHFPAVGKLVRTAQREHLEIRVDAVLLVHGAAAIFADHVEAAVVLRGRGAVGKVDAERLDIALADGGGIGRRAGVGKARHRDRQVLVERRAVVDHQYVGARGGLAVVAGVHQVAAYLAATVGRVAGIAHAVAAAVEAADRAGQVRRQRARDKRVLAQEAVVGILHLVAARQAVAAGAGHVVDGGAQAVRIQDAAGAALDQFHALGHQVVADKDVVVHERRFRFLVGRQAIDQLRREAVAARHRQAAHGDVVAGLSRAAALGIDAGEVGQHVGRAHRRQTLDFLAAQRVDRERGVFLGGALRHAGDDDHGGRAPGKSPGLPNG